MLNFFGKYFLCKEILKYFPKTSHNIFCGDDPVVINGLAWFPVLSH